LHLLQSPLERSTSFHTPVRHQLHVPAYNVGNFMRTLAMPKAAHPRSLTSLREKLIKIGARSPGTGAT